MKNDGVEFVEKLREFRDGLDKDQRELFRKLLGGAVAALASVRKVEAPPGARSLVDKLVGLRDGLPPRQREALTATILASGAAWAARAATDGERPVEDEGRVTYFLGPFFRALGEAVAHAILHEMGAGEVVDEIRELVDPVDVPDVDVPT